MTCGEDEETPLPYRGTFVDRARIGKTALSASIITLGNRGTAIPVSACDATATYGISP